MAVFSMLVVPMTFGLGIGLAASRIADWRANVTPNRAGPPPVDHFEIRLLDELNGE